MTYKYGSDFETAVLANANCGGENVARGTIKRKFQGWKVPGLEVVLSDGAPVLVIHLLCTTWRGTYSHSYMFLQ